MKSANVGVSAVRSVEFGVSDLTRSVAFYERVWGLEHVHGDDDHVFLRGSGTEFYIVGLQRHAQPGLVKATFAASSRADVDALQSSIAALGLYTSGEPAALHDGGGGYGFSFSDPAGRAFAITSDVTLHAESTDREDRPSKISHLVLNAADVQADAAFFCDVLGFRLRDQTARMTFLGCNADHHSVALVRDTRTSLNHVAFEVPDIDSLMRGGARVRRAGTPLEWGVGRHGPGNNIFAYFCDPDDLAIEYTTEVAQVNDAIYRPGRPEDWKPPIEGNPDYWGFAALPSERFKRASEGRPSAISAHDTAPRGGKPIEVFLSHDEERLDR